MSIRMNFCDVFEDVTKKGRKLQTSEYQVSGMYPIFDQGQQEIAGYTNETEGLFTDIPAVLFGDHTRIVKYIDRPCFLGADGVKLLKPLSHNVNVKYLFYVVSSIQIPDTGYNRHFKWLKESSIIIPEEDEQKRIVDILDKINVMISLRKKQLQKLDDLVKARFVEMFGNHSGRRRFEEYSVLITKGASPKWQGIDYCDEGTLFVTSENVREGYVDLSKRKYLPNEINSILPRSVLQRNDVLINIVGASIGRAAIFESDELANINQAVAVVRLKKDVLDLRFLITFLNSEEAQKAYGVMKKGGARDNLSLQNISDLLIPIATIEEQQHYSSFVSQVDKSKLSIQKSLEKLENLKQSLMQKYFG